MRNTIFSHPVILLKFVASVMYIVMGVLISLMPEAFGDLLSGITPLLVNAFTVLLIVYGVSRFIRTRNEYRDIKLNQQAHETTDQP